MTHVVCVCGYCLYTAIWQSCNWQQTHLIGMGGVHKHILNVQCVEGELQPGAQTLALHPQRQSRLPPCHITVGHPRVAEREREREGERERERESERERLVNSHCIASPGSRSQPHLMAWSGWNMMVTRACEFGQISPSTGSITMALSE